MTGTAKPGRAREMLNTFKGNVAAARKVQPHNRQDDELGLRSLFTAFPGVNPFNLTTDLPRNREVMKRLTEKQLTAVLTLIILENPPTPVVEAILEAAKQVGYDELFERAGLSSTRASEAHPGMAQKALPVMQDAQYRVFEGGNLQKISYERAKELAANGYVPNQRNRSGKVYVVMTPPTTTPASSGRRASGTTTRGTTPAPSTGSATPARTTRSSDARRGSASSASRRSGTGRR